MPTFDNVLSGHLLVEGEKVTGANPLPVTLSGGGSPSVTVLSSVRNTGLTNTSSAIKGTAGIVYGWNLVNTNATPVYVKLYNVVTATVGTTTPARVLAVPAQGGFFLENSSTPQHNFTTAISMACVTGIADADSTAPTTPIHAEVYYV